MNKKLVIVIALLAIIAIATNLSLYKYYQSKISQKDEILRKESAASVAKNFYNHYVIEGYFRSQNKIYTSAPLQEFAVDKYITKELDVYLRQSVKPLGYDHVLCIQDLPREIGIKEIEMKGGDVIIKIQFNSEISDEARPIVYLKMFDSEWRIYKIDCEGID